MQSRPIRRSGQPTCANASRMRGFDRDLIRGRHYGQRPCVPREQAEHMAAPTSLRTCRKALLTRSRPHMAQSGHPEMSAICPLSGAKRTLVACSDLPRVEKCMRRSGHRSSCVVLRIVSYRRVELVVRLLRTAARTGCVRFLFLPCSALLFAPSSGGPQALG